MKTNQELYNEHIKRINTVIALEKPDRTPICINGDIALLKYYNPEAKASEYTFSSKQTHLSAVKGAYKLGGGEVDSIMISAMNTKMIGAASLAKTKLPGQDLKEDQMWQVDEVGILTEEDYDTILDKGWNAVSNGILFDRLGYSLDMIKESMDSRIAASEECEKLGMVELLRNGNPTPIAFNMLFGGRGIINFIKDMRKNPEKVEGVIEVMTFDILKGLKNQLETGGLFCTFIGGARASGDYISAKQFERFAWTTYKLTAETILEGGVHPFFHVDSNWEARLEYFKDFPKARCIFDPDSMTNIFKIKEILGDRMCITGDLPPAMSAIGSSEDVYNYTSKLVKEIGPEGFIMASGCTLPPNAKPENLEAIVAACLSK